MTRKCVICGREFDTPPSNNKITCSKECSSVRKSQSHIGKSHPWPDEKKSSAREAARRTGNLLKGSAAAMRLPESQRGPQHREAKIWHLRDPEGNSVTVINLIDWARLHAQDCFGMEPTDHNAFVIASGIRQIKRSMEGKRMQHGKPAPITSYKGWTLVAWEEKAKP